MLLIDIVSGSVDNAAEGIFLAKFGQGDNSWTMPADNPYTGEISVVRDTNDTLVFFTEW